MNHHCDKCKIQFNSEIGYATHDCKPPTLDRMPSEEEVEAAKSWLCKCDEETGFMKGVAWLKSRMQNAKTDPRDHPDSLHRRFNLPKDDYKAPVFSTEPPAQQGAEDVERMANEDAEKALYVPHEMRYRSFRRDGFKAGYRAAQKLSQEQTARHQEEVQKLREALEWYAAWDWTDKYCQPVPKRARQILAKWPKEKT